MLFQQLSENESVESTGASERGGRETRTLPVVKDMHFHWSALKILHEDMGGEMFGLAHIFTQPTNLLSLLAEYGT